MNFTEHTLSLEIRPDMAGLATALERLDQFWQNSLLAEDAQADLNIAVEEIVSNVIRHADSTTPIALTVTLDEDRIRVEVQDSGSAFDPLTHPMPDPNSPLEQRRAGGLGIFMVTKMMDEVRYERREGRNCLTMVRNRV